MAYTGCWVIELELDEVAVDDGAELERGRLDCAVLELVVMELAVLELIAVDDSAIAEDSLLAELDGLVGVVAGDATQPDIKAEKARASGIGRVISALFLELWSVVWG